MIGQALGGTVVKAKRPLHGKADWIYHQAQGVFSQLPSPLSVGRYHSLIVQRHSLPSAFNILAYSAEGEIMAIQYQNFNTFGVQFHPESILTQYGLALLKNFLTLPDQSKGVEYVLSQQAQLTQIEL